MPVTNHVTSLELSRRLKELGVTQKTIFSWATDEELLHLPLMPNQYVDCSAYLASELGEMLPAHYISYWQIKNEDMEKEWFCEYLDENKYKRCSSADTEANAKAKMLIHLLENHLISVEELGKWGV